MVKEEDIELAGVMEKQTAFDEVYSPLENLLKSNIDILVCSAKAYHVDSIIKLINIRNIKKLK